MIKLLKLLKSLKAQGFASVEAKAEVKALVKEAGADAEVVADEVAEVDALPETAKVEGESVEEAKAMITKIFGKTASDLEAKLSDKLVAEVKSIKEDISAFAKKAITTKVVKSAIELDANTKASLAVIAKGGKADITIDAKDFNYAIVKTAGDISIDGNVTGELPQAELDTVVSRDPQRSPFVQELVRVGTISSNLDAWIETTGEDGEPAPVAELASIPAKDWDFARKTRAVQKIAVHTKYSKEMAEDLPNLVSEIKNFLVTDLKRVVDTQILNGDGTGENLVGILEHAVAYNAGSFAGTIANANYFDAIETASAQVITALHTPNVVVVHPIALSKMRLAKDANGAYVLPPFITANGTTVSGLRVVANTGIGADKFLVGDFTKSVVKYRQGITVEMSNTDADDFTKDRFTVKATVRLLQRVRENDYEAFVYGTFSTAVASLESGS